MLSFEFTQIEGGAPGEPFHGKHTVGVKHDCPRAGMIGTLVSAETKEDAIIECVAWVAHIVQEALEAGEGAG